MQDVRELPNEDKSQDRDDLVTEFTVDSLQQVVTKSIPMQPVIEEVEDDDENKEDSLSDNIECELSIDEILEKAVEPPKIQYEQSAVDTYIQSMQDDDVIEIGNSVSDLRSAAAKFAVSGSVSAPGYGVSSRPYTEIPSYNDYERYTGGFDEGVGEGDVDYYEERQRDLSDLMSQSDTVIDLVLKLTAEVKRLSDKVQSLEDRILM